MIVLQTYPATRGAARRRARATNMIKRRRWLLLGCAARGAAQFADTRVFELGSSSKTNMLADAVVRDEAAGCLESPGISRRYGDRCVAQEADAVDTCLKLSNCLAFTCLPSVSFRDLPDKIGIDDEGLPIGAQAATIKLWDAAKRGNAGEVSSSLKQGADIDAKDARQGRTALMYACASESLPTVRALLEAGASTRPTDKKGLTALDFAVNNYDLNGVGSAPPNQNKRINKQPRQDAVRHAIRNALVKQATAEQAAQDSFEKPTVYGSSEELAALSRSVNAEDPQMKRSAARSAALLHDGIDGRLCVFHSSHVELKARDEGHELCDANGTDVSSTHRNRRATPSRECDRFLFSIKTVRDVLDLRRLPGVAQRAILNAAKEKRTALIYDAPLGVVEWQRRLRDVARGQLRHPITGKSRRLAVLDGSALQTCAPRCPAKPLTDARKTWARTSSVFRDATKSFTVGHKANETAASSVAAGVAGVGDADWLENLGGNMADERARPSADYVASTLELGDPLVGAFPWES